MPHVILFEHANYHGAHRHVIGWEPNLNSSDDNYFNDRVSSIVVLSGIWAFFRDAGYHSQYARTLGPGIGTSWGGGDSKDDDVSPLLHMSAAGMSQTPHVILFEHANYHGAHKHVFGAEPNLNASDDGYFNDRVSSMVVLSGVWAFFRDAGYHGQYARTLGP